MTYTAEEREARNVAAQARYRARHPGANGAAIARHRANHPRETQKPYEPVTGTMGAIESPDVIESVAPNLREQYLVALLARDAKIWHRTQHKNEAMAAGEDALSPMQASRAIKRENENTYEAHRPCQKCGGTERYLSTQQCVACARLRRNNATKRRTLSEAEKEKRRAAWTPERREAQRQQTDGRGRPAKSNARADAKAAGKMTYLRERACDKCGGHVYLVSNWSCVGCRHNTRGAASRPDVPRLSQFKRLDTFSSRSKPKFPQVKDRQFATR